MLFAKTPLKKAQEVKKYLSNKDFLNKKFKGVKDKEFIYFPITENANIKVIEGIKKQFDFLEFSEKTTEKKQDLRNYKNILKNKLNKEEFALLPSAYDVIGDIIVLDLDKKLVKKEKIIGNALLTAYKNIKTVLKKADIHSGVFRTQKMKHVVGENKKITTHRENNTILKLDVEKVYFSTRSSSERKRINNLVKKDEEVLVMFSGCGAFVFNISKNTQANDVYGIEINPIAHKFALENKKLNKSHNTILIKGDVREITPEVYKHIIGLKSSDKESQFQKRIIEHPVLMEFHLFYDDLYKNKTKLEKKIENLKKKEIEIVLHMPFYLNLAATNPKEINDVITTLSILGEMCKKYDCKAIVHGAWMSDLKRWKKDYNEETHLKNLDKIKKYFDYFYFENSHNSTFSDLKDILKIAKKANMKNICIDVAHAFIQLKSNKKLIEFIERIKKDYNTYFHLSDSDGVKEGMVIGKGNIAWHKVLPLVNKGITEVKSKDEEHPFEMIKSFEKIEGLRKKFDRIVMPLPKSASDFLDSALIAAKKGTIIHFYDFLHEKDFPVKSVEKIEKVCKKLKRKFHVLNYVKCGQYSPKTFRVCIDFKMLN